MSNQKNKSYPLFRWAGGKADLAPTIVRKLKRSPSMERYIEPFMGAASVFRTLNPQCPSILNDVNPELTCVFRSVKDDPHALMTRLDAMSDLRNKEGFLEVREWDRDPDFTRNYTVLDRAARFLFLQALGFNGLWRVNGAGYYNVSFGQADNRALYKPDVIAQFHTLLNNTEITTGCYSNALEHAQKGDTVYLDPPYIKVTDSQFKFCPKGFTLENQGSLAEKLKIASDEGVYFVLSNSDTPLSRKLYKDFKVRKISVRRSISRNGDGRQPVGELIVSNF